MTANIHHARYKLTCPFHRRYDPAREGDGGIKGGCAICWDLFRLWKLSIELDDFYHGVSEKIIAARKE